MTDTIDENNWKTISEIFGGVSQSVAEDMLQENSSSEEVDELIEEYQEDIDEIQNFILWANNDETEWATKDAIFNICLTF
jgi:DNA-binding ferritin-like protein (Dps family)